MKSTTAVVSLMFLAVHLHSCFSIKCYECHSESNDGCLEIDGKTIDDKYLRTCPENNQCSSIVVNTNGTNHIFRSCETNGTTFSLNTCNSDGCNRNGVEATTFNKSGHVKCYDCYSGPYSRNPQCEEIVGDKYLHDCKSDEEYCSTFTVLNSDESIHEIFRRCIKYDDKLVSQLRCEEDKCNSNI